MGKMPVFRSGGHLLSVSLAWCALMTAGCASSDEAAMTVSPEASSPLQPLLHFDDAGLTTGSSCPTDRSLTYESFGRAFFAMYCTRCHARDKVGAARNGATDGFDYDTLEGITRHFRAIDSNAAAGPLKVNQIMPFNDPRPVEAERRQLGAWLACREGVELDAGTAR